jgi:hypothetical protein
VQLLVCSVLVCSVQCISELITVCSVCVVCSVVVVCSVWCVGGSAQCVINAVCSVQCVVCSV